MKNQIIPFLLLTLVSFLSCEIVNFRNPPLEDEVEGLKPIYSAADWDDIAVLPPQPIDVLGKIYYKAPYIYVNELNKGIHVMDNSDPADPIPVSFIQIWGSKDIAIKGDILYADNVSDLVALDISELTEIEVTKRVKGLYNTFDKDYPEGYNGYFECVDDTKGLLIGWETALLENPECFR